MDRCGSCRWCLRGLDNHCAYVHVAPSDGLPAGPRGLSSHLMTSAEKLLRLNHAVGLRQGALLEPLACTLRSIRRSGVQAGNLAVVIGTGTLGLLHAAVLREMKVEVVVCDVDGSSKGRLNEVRNSEGADAVFCIRGGGASIQGAVEACARGGTVVLFQSVLEGGDVSLNANDIHYREISIVGSISQRMEDFWQAKSLIEQTPGLLDVLNVVCVPHRSPKEAFEKSLDPSVNRVLVTFD